MYAYFIARLGLRRRRAERREGSGWEDGGGRGRWGGGRGVGARGGGGGRKVLVKKNTLDLKPEAIRSAEF